MHSSRMRTGRSLSLFRGGDVPGRGGVPGPGDVPGRGVYLVRGGCVPGPGGLPGTPPGQTRYPPPGPDQVHPPC